MFIINRRKIKTLKLDKFTKKKNVKTGFGGLCSVESNETISKVNLVVMERVTQCVNLETKLVQLI